MPRTRIDPGGSPPAEGSMTASHSDLMIGGGGSVAVASSTLFSYRAALDDLELEFQACAAAVGRIDRGVTSGMLAAAEAPLSASRAEAAMDEAIVHLDAARQASSTISTALTLSADAYGQAESAADRWMQSLGAGIGAAVGSAATAAAPFLIGPVLLAAAGLGSGYLLSRALNPEGTDVAIERIGRLLDAHKGLLTDPVVVQFVRVAVQSSDDVVGGALHLPPGVLGALGDEGLGILGPDTVAGGLGTVAGLGGMLRETPVRTVERMPMTTAAAIHGANGTTAVGGIAKSTPSPGGTDGIPPSVPVTGLAARADRIPTGDAQIRIDRYVVPGQRDRYEVYVSGTQVFSPVATDQPFDLTSDVTALAGQDAGSMVALEQALADAGVDADSPIVVTGHSQGGLIAAQLAASGDYDVRGLYTVGAPVAQVDVPASIPWVAIEHTDDVVPAVGGIWHDDSAVLVRREVYDGFPPEDAAIFPAHQLTEYRETAASADASVEPRLVDTVRQLDAVTSRTARVETTFYRSVRETAEP